MGTNTGETVILDDRGRITLPKHIRTRLQLGEGDTFNLDIDDGDIHLEPTRPSFEPIQSGKVDWGSETFMSAGEALFGEVEEGDDTIRE